MFLCGSDPEKLYQEQLEQSTVCTRTQIVDGTDIMTFTESIGPVLSPSGTGGTQSLGNGSAAGSERGRGESPQRPVLVVSHPGLPSIDEVDSPEKNEDGVIEPITIGLQVAVQNEDRVTEPTGEGFLGMSCKEGVEIELEERIKKLREEAENFERLQKLRQEARELERRKKLREEAELDFDRNKSSAEGVNRAVVKVPQAPPLPPTDTEKENGVNKRKTRSEIAAEEAAKELEEARKKNRKPKRNQRITPLG